MSAFVECPACQRRLVAKPGNDGTFKSECPHKGCGAAMLCTIEPNGVLSVLGPSKLHEVDKQNQVAVELSERARSFWAPAGIIVGLFFTVGLFLVLPFALMFFGGAGIIMAILGFVAVGAAVLVLVFIGKRLFTKPTPRLRTIEGALETWTEPGGYRG